MKSARPADNVMAVVVVAGREGKVEICPLPCPPFYLLSWSSHVGRVVGLLHKCLPLLLPFWP